MSSSSVSSPAVVGRAPQFSCRRFLSGDASHVVPTGELDIGTVPELDCVLRRAAAGAALVVLDLRELEFIDSSGAHLLLETQKRIERAAGRLVVVVRFGDDVEWLLALTGADRQLELVAEPPTATAPLREVVETTTL